MSVTSGNIVLNSEMERYYVQNDSDDIAPITSVSIDMMPSVIDRFFTRYYYIKQESEGSVPYQVLFHTNRICLICVPPEHPIRLDGIAGLTFDIGNTDRSKNSVTGKGKKGGMVLQADSTLAILTSATGKTYKVPSCIPGKLVEVNINLSELPQSLESDNEGEAYLAIILPKPEQCEAIKSGLMSEHQYKDYLTKSK